MTLFLKKVRIKVIAENVGVGEKFVVEIENFGYRLH